VRPVKIAVATGAMLAFLSACATPVPDSGSGVGFSNYSEYELERARREAALTGTAQPSANPTALTTGTISSEELAAVGIGDPVQPGAPLSAIDRPQTTDVQNGRAAGLDASPANSAPQLANNPRISDEQDFNAVTSRQSIESDANRRAQQAAARQQVQPTALPTRSGAGGPNIVAYALNAPNQKGQEWYSRSLLSGESRFQRNCASYNTPDDAQRDFLARGGPERDPRGIDPDGDGFACGWDPAPFRLAAGN